MAQPIPLPNKIPKGTKLTIGYDTYEFVSEGTLNSFTNPFTGLSFVYTGEIKNLTNGSKFSSYDVSLSCIDWDTYTLSSSEEIFEVEIVKINQCLWCKTSLDTCTDRQFCVSSKQCENYYAALKDRMFVDFRTPDDAFESEKEAVKRWVDNLLQKK